MRFRIHDGVMRFGFPLFDSSATHATRAKRSTVMKSATKWFMLMHVFASGSGRNAACQLACRRFLRSCLWLLGVFLLAGGLVQAAVIKEGDILVADQNANKLFVVDAETGARTVVSNFSDPSQGPTSGQDLGGVALQRGQIIVTSLFTGIF